MKKRYRGTSSMREPVRSTYAGCRDDVAVEKRLRSYARRPVKHVLAPCPDCGSEAMCSQGRVVCMSMSCSRVGPMRSGREYAVKAWNEEVARG